MREANSQIKAEAAARKEAEDSLREAIPRLEAAEVRPRAGPCCAVLCLHREGCRCDLCRRSLYFTPKGPRTLTFPRGAYHVLAQAHGADLAKADHEIQDQRARLSRAKQAFDRKAAELGEAAGN